jgi:hypothetical protein
MSTLAAVVTSLTAVVCYSVYTHGCVNDTCEELFFTGAHVVVPADSDTTVSSVGSDDGGRKNPS